MPIIYETELADPTAIERDDRRDAGLQKLADNAGRLTPLRLHWQGRQPAAFLSAEAIESLDKRLKSLSVNFPRLAVMTIAERLNLAGIIDTRASRPLADNYGGRAESLWELLTEAGIEVSANKIHTDTQLYGTGYATVWATEQSRLTITADNPWTVSHAEDPATGDTEYAVRAWSDSRVARAVLYEPDRITKYVMPGTTDYSPGSGWKTVGALDNPLGVVPVVPFVRRLSATDPPTGESAVADILDLTDAVAKLLADGMVTSEFFARPRRWATGLEIQEDDEGNPVDPFGKGRFLQSEDDKTKFGQLDPARMDGYGDLIATITQQIGSLTGLPPTYLGLHGDQPASVDAIKAAEVQLTMRAYTEQQRMTRPWQDVAWLAAAVLAHAPAAPENRRRYHVAWSSPEIRTQAQATDAAAKLRGIGVPLSALLEDPLGYSPDKAAEITAAAAAETPVTPR